MDRRQVDPKRELFRKLLRNIPSETVIRAMEQVPRDLFVPQDSRHMAYLDLPLSIGEEQTISQPYIVAMMTEALELSGGDRVLEIGTGSGYQTAILSALTPRGRVVSMERVPALMQQARQRLQELGYRNVEVQQAGSSLGCPSKGPYDAIIVTAAAPRLPESLLSQLAIGGRLVIPVGTLSQQELVQARRTDEGLSLRVLGPCRFVPLLGAEAFPQP
ncbi:MAG TPA: protein-L-isoaspartate(D-aspartate) O-methyltransferase [Dehalococcoidia bacterium]|jgi:protein-L-isoaspartate(D-aspartate) O-methyltransferase|nr:protein-L-isoaspartate(D-aspartate) O-methyltransferase [Dehalococcoidia bacterium]HIB13581.1 protein-L-isoaspartate(D-aspartate) O-methyltransferase [Dehalococcoidia bacterium]HIM48518.1 protein-L-isoaspartate(D-aspartate) O-methyltransferase [Dehalococcoidia bacterium]